MTPLTPYELGWASAVVSATAEAHNGSEMPILGATPETTVRGYYVAPSGLVGVPPHCSVPQRARHDGRNNCYGDYGREGRRDAPQGELMQLLVVSDA